MQTDGWPAGKPTSKPTSKQTDEQSADEQSNRRAISRRAIKPTSNQTDEQSKLRQSPSSLARTQLGAGARPSGPRLARTMIAAHPSSRQSVVPCRCEKWVQREKSASAPHTSARRVDNHVRHLIWSAQRLRRPAPGKNHDSRASLQPPVRGSMLVREVGATREVCERSPHVRQTRR